jgi:hypothetical protein
MRILIIIILLIGLFLISCNTPLGVHKNHDSDGIADHSIKEHYCKEENKVYHCGEYIKIVNTLEEVKYFLNEKEISCPIIDPDEMTQECYELKYHADCKEVC